MRCRRSGEIDALIGGVAARPPPVMFVDPAVAWSPTRIAIADRPARGLRKAASD